jgi:hypothetical protein
LDPDKQGFKQKKRVVRLQPAEANRPIEMDARALDSRSAFDDGSNVPVFNHGFCELVARSSS